MKIIADAIAVETGGENDVKDLTAAIAGTLTRSGLRDGTVTVFVPGSTAGLTTIEFESGVIEDFSRLLEKIAPSNVPYRHDQRWGDGNGYSHVRASLIGPSLVIPFSGGRLALGTWQQAVLVDFDNRPRRRSIVLQFMGE
ncbi:MAG: secondary thiamine-phosphate synthase enzyme YjbQ [Candidatus Aminicenantales bacterium]|jgi:secondary thiamine-phosphate synthase enzyme